MEVVGKGTNVGRLRVKANRVYYGVTCTWALTQNEAVGYRITAGAKATE
ncbi:hypothetical protein OH492_10070 [Vibrio chagasii]|nr:hypothetical protein [Vibrio chagasii]